MTESLHKFTGLMLMYVEQLTSGRRPSDQANRLGPLVRLLAAIAHIHHHHLLLLLSLKVDVNFTVPWRVER